MNLFGDHPGEQDIIAIEIDRRKQLGKTKLQEVILPFYLAPLLQDAVDL